MDCVCSAQDATDEPSYRSHAGIHSFRSVCHFAASMSSEENDDIPEAAAIQCHVHRLAKISTFMPYTKSPFQTQQVSTEPDQA
jgi:hypothetical protein